MTNRFLALLAERPYLLADGATGTNLFDAGLQTGDAPELWNEQHPEGILKLHRDMIAAGADLILTNSFGGTRHRLKLHNEQDRVAPINERAARIAREAADAAGRPIIVAGSMGPTGELIEPLGQLSMTACAEAFEEQAKALAAGGVDVLWIETMSSPEELAAAVEGAGRIGLPIVTTLSFDTNGRTMMGVTPAAAVEVFHSLSPGPAAFGANCGVGASELTAAVAGMARSAAKGDVIVAKGNCGVPSWQDGHIHYDGTPELMADYARLVRDAGARIIGGCCGTTPAHLEAMSEALKAHTPGEMPSTEAIMARLGRLTEGTLRLCGGAAVESRPDGDGSRPRRRARRGEAETPAA